MRGSFGASSDSGRRARHCCNRLGEIIEYLCRSGSPTLELLSTSSPATVTPLPHDHLKPGLLAKAAQSAIDELASLFAAHPALVRSLDRADIDEIAQFVTFTAAELAWPCGTEEEAEAGKELLLSAAVVLSALHKGHDDVPQARWCSLLLDSNATAVERLASTWCGEAAPRSHFAEALCAWLSQLAPLARPASNVMRLLSTIKHVHLGALTDSMHLLSSYEIMLDKLDADDAAANNNGDSVGTSGGGGGGRGSSSLLPASSSPSALYDRLAAARARRALTRELQQHVVAVQGGWDRGHHEIVKANAAAVDRACRDYVSGEAAVHIWLLEHRSRGNTQVEVWSDVTATTLLCKYRRLSEKLFRQLRLRSERGGVDSSRPPASSSSSLPSSRQQQQRARSVPPPLPGATELAACASLLSSLAEVEPRVSQLLARRGAWRCTVRALQLLDPAVRSQSDALEQTLESGGRLEDLQVAADIQVWECYEQSARLTTVILAAADQNARVQHARWQARLRSREGGARRTAAAVAAAAAAEAAMDAGARAAGLGAIVRRLTLHTRLAVEVRRHCAAPRGECCGLVAAMAEPLSQLACALTTLHKTLVKVRMTRNAAAAGRAVMRRTRLLTLAKVQLVAQAMAVVNQQDSVSVGPTPWSADHTHSCLHALLVLVATSSLPDGPSSAPAFPAAASTIASATSRGGGGGYSPDDRDQVPLLQQLFCDVLTEQWWSHGAHPHNSVCRAVDELTKAGGGGGGCSDMCVAGGLVPAAHPTAAPPGFTSRCTLVPARDASLMHYTSSNHSTSSSTSSSSSVNDICSSIVAGDSVAPAHPPPCLRSPAVPLKALLSRLSTSAWRSPTALADAIVDLCEMCDRPAAATADAVTATAAPTRSPRQQQRTAAAAATAATAAAAAAATAAAGAAAMWVRVKHPDACMLDPSENMRALVVDLLTKLLQWEVRLVPGKAPPPPPPPPPWRQSEGLPLERPRRVVLSDADVEVFLLFVQGLHTLLRLDGPGFAQVIWDLPAQVWVGDGASVWVSEGTADRTAVERSDEPAGGTADGVIASGTDDGACGATADDLAGEAGNGTADGTAEGTWCGTVTGRAGRTAVRAADGTSVWAYGGGTVGETADGTADDPAGGRANGTVGGMSGGTAGETSDDGAGGGTTDRPAGGAARETCDKPAAGRTYNRTAGKTLEHPAGGTPCGTAGGLSEETAGKTSDDRAGGTADRTADATGDVMGRHGGAGDRSAAVRSCTPTPYDVGAGAGAAEGSSADGSDGAASTGAAPNDADDVDDDTAMSMPLSFTEVVLLLVAVAGHIEDDEAADAAAAAVAWGGSKSPAGGGGDDGAGSSLSSPSRRPRFASTMRFVSVVTAFLQDVLLQLPELRDDLAMCLS